MKKPKLPKQSPAGLIIFAIFGAALIVASFLLILAYNYLDVFFRISFGAPKNSLAGAAIALMLLPLIAGSYMVFYTVSSFLFAAKSHIKTATLLFGTLGAVFIGYYWFVVWHASNQIR